MLRTLYWLTGLEAAIAANHGAFSGAPGDGIVSENGRVANFLLTIQVAIEMPALLDQPAVAPATRNSVNLAPLVW